MNVAKMSLAQNPSTDLAEILSQFFPHKVRSFLSILILVRSPVSEKKLIMKKIEIIQSTQES